MHRCICCPRLIDSAVPRGAKAWGASRPTGAPARIARSAPWRCIANSARTCRTRLCNAAARQLTRHRSVVTQAEMQEVRIALKMPVLCPGQGVSQDVPHLYGTCATRSAGPGPVMRDTTLTNRLVRRGLWLTI